MKNFGARLKEERERLGFSSATFAEKCGVGRTAQFNYERGQREPDSSYLSLAESAGVDLTYVFSGKRREDAARASLNEELDGFGRAFAQILEISEGDLLRARQAVSDGMEEHNAALERSGRVNSGKWRAAYQEEYLKAVEPLVENCQKIKELTSKQLDLGMLSTVIERVESSLPERCSISPAKKAGAIAALYCAYKASGKLDQAMTEEIVKLAVT